LNHREIAEDALDLLANVRVTLPISTSTAEISLYFPAKQGIPQAEAGSPMTASTANFYGIQSGRTAAIANQLQTVRRRSN
jgi:hypothetical protein